LTTVVAAYNSVLEFKVEWRITVFLIINPAAAFYILTLLLWKGFILADTSEIFRKWQHSFYLQFSGPFNFCLKAGGQI